MFSESKRGVAREPSEIAQCGTKRKWLFRGPVAAVKMPGDMTEQMFQAIISSAECEADDEGMSRLPAGQTLTLYAGHEGVSLQAGRLVAVKLADGIVKALNSKGEMFVLALADLFAASLSCSDEKGASRKAGFLG